MSHYTQYPTSKESGVEWLGDIPEHWNVVRMKNVIISAQNGYWGEEPTGGADDVLCARVADFDRTNLTVDGDLPTIRSVPAYQRESRQVNNGDLLFEKSGGGEQTLVGVVVQYLGRAPAICSNFVAVVKCKAGISSRWLCYTNAHLYSVGVNRRSIKQTTGIQNIDSEEYFSETIAVPPKDEQGSIAAYLDYETARIDVLVSKKTRFIELLREKRQALITHAVTKGLDPNVKMKDSSVEWLGGVPNGWYVTPLKYIGSAIIGLTYSPADVVDEGDGTLVLRSSNIQDGRITLDDNVYVKADIPNRLITRLGDILICSRNGSRSLIGKNGIVDATTEGLSFGAFTTVFRTSHHKFLYYVLNSSLFKFQAGRFLTTTINQLTTETLNSFEIPLPPCDEQDAITAHLDRETIRLDTLISKTERSIDLLKERRSALITAAVTGQIDVRENTLRRDQLAA